MIPGHVGYAETQRIAKIRDPHARLTALIELTDALKRDRERLETLRGTWLVQTQADERLTDEATAQRFGVDRKTVIARRKRAEQNAD